MLLTEVKPFIAHPITGRVYRFLDNIDFIEFCVDQYLFQSNFSAGYFLNEFRIVFIHQRISMEKLTVDEC